MASERFEMKGRKLVYECATDSWHEDSVRLLVESEPFQEGGMRLAFRAREVFSDGSASDVVLKCFKPEILEEGENEADLIKSEAMTQMVAEDYAQQWNKLAASKGLEQRLAFLPVSVVVVPASGGTPEETYSIEPYLPGECACSRLSMPHQSRLPTAPSAS